MSASKLIACCLAACCAAGIVARAEAPQAPDYPALPKPGSKVPLGSGHYFVYEFDKTPKIGMPILRVEIFTNDGTRDTSFVVKGDADMPAMAGAHSTGSTDFSLSKKGVYLLPVRVVMPGEWEVNLTFLKEGSVVMRGSYRFNV